MLSNSIHYFCLLQQGDAVIAASKSVVASDHLKKVFEVILAFGNYMNSSKRGGVYGFKLQSLDIVSLSITLLPILRLLAMERHIFIVSERVQKKKRVCVGLQYLVVHTCRHQTIRIWSKNLVKFKHKRIGPCDLDINY